MNVFLQRLSLPFRLKHSFYSRLPSSVDIRNYRQFEMFTLQRNGKRDLFIRLSLDLCYTNQYILGHSPSKKTISLTSSRPRDVPQYHSVHR
jgi:hypothetical protein